MTKRSTTLPAPAVRKTRRVSEGPNTGRRAAVSRTGPLAGLDVAARHPLLPSSTRRRRPCPCVSTPTSACCHIISSATSR